MGLVASWEEFLERALVRYVAGVSTTSGYAPTPKFGIATDLNHAYQILSRDAGFNPDVNFLKVTDPKWVDSTADFIFSSHPFGILHANIWLLSCASDIRNRVAHESRKCKIAFKKTAIAFLQPTNNTLSQGFGPGALLEGPVLRHFPQRAIQGGLSHFDAYCAFFERLAKHIVP